MSVWWEQRAALLEHAVAMIAAQTQCGVDAALLLLKLRARAAGRDLEEVAAAVVDGGISFSPECPSPPPADPSQVPARTPTGTGGTRRRG